jgi:hypothetical protein
MVTPREDTCSCGHPVGPHQLCGYIDERVGAPTSGWMECPECDCAKTWSVSPELLTVLEEAAPDA